MKTLNVRFGEAYKVSMPTLMPYLQGHDGIGFEKVDRAPLEPNSAPWTALERLLKKPAGLVNAYDPVKKEKATYIITNGPTQDTFDRAQTLKSQVKSPADGQQGDADSQEGSAFACVMPDLIKGDELVIELDENLTQQANTLIQHGLAEPDVLEALQR